MPSGLGTYVIRVDVSDPHDARASGAVQVTVTRAVGLFDPGADFSALWNPSKDAIGWATEKERSRPKNDANPPAAKQAFQGGLMIWYRDEAKIYVIYNDRTWQVFADTWNESQPAQTCPGPQPATPVRGFNKVWCTQPGVKDRLGNAVEYELGEAQIVQVFENAILLTSRDQARMYVLFNNGTWQ
jgi:hypothetical protein